MAQFEVVTLSEAAARTATGRRARTLQEYLEYIGRLQTGQAGKLRPSEGETVAAIRRRLGAAAKLAKKKLVIKRTGEEVYFWVAEEAAAPRRRGRRKKVAS